MGNRDEIKREAEEAAREAKEAAKEAKEAVKEAAKEAREAAKEAVGNIDDLRREAEEAKEKIKSDIEEAGDILRRIAEESAQTGTGKADEAVRRTEKWIGRMTERVEKRLGRAMTIAAKSPGDDGGVVTREFDFSDFTNVEVGSAFRVEVTHSDSYQVSVTAGARMFDYLDITRSGSTVKISAKSHRFSSRTPREARITMPVLRKLRLSGAARSTVKGFSSEEDLDVNVSGASNLEIDMEAGNSKFEISGAGRVNGNVKLGNAEFTLSGASTAHLSGSANNVVLSGWGASRLDLAGLNINDADVNLKGASRAMCGRCCGELALDLSGASRLEYAGEPTIRDIKVSGSSTVRKK